MLLKRQLLGLCFALSSLFLLTSCAEEPDTTAAEVLPAAKSYIQTGDLSEIKKHKKLRILTMPLAERWLPRKGSSFISEQEMAIILAKQLQLEPVLIVVDKFEDLIPALIEGRGDIVAANLTITTARKEKVEFTVPVMHSQERIVTRKNEQIKNIKALTNRTIAYQAETSYEDTITEIKTKQPGIKTQILPGNLSKDQVLDKLVNNEIDLSIIDSNLLKIITTYRNDFNSGPSLTDERPLAWALRKDSPELLKATNLFLTHEKLTQKNESIHTDDLDTIKKRKTLRVITRNNAASYFLWRGELLGFEYELAKAFAKQHNLRLEIITAPSHKAQIPMLLEGKGDIIASFMTVTDKRKNQGVTFSRHSHIVTEMIVARADDKINKLESLTGRSVHVRKSSAYWGTLQALQKNYNFKIQAVPETMETEEIISRVASGEFDLTLADNHLLDIELTWRDDIKAAFPVNKPRKTAWAMRSNNPQLTAAVNQFLKKQYRSLFYNITYNKYFKNSHKIKAYRDQRIDLNPDGTLSPYDTLIKKYANQYNFDWRLLVAQMYQESRFKPDAKSWVGAEGLMQVMPRTAKEMGIKNLKDPESGIKAGVKYLDWVRDRFETELNVKDRMWFILASYNAGQGHVKDARRLAKQQGLNPNRWFDNVEKAMLLLSKRKYASKARYGYVRGSEPVQYVREINRRYKAYLALVESE